MFVFFNAHTEVNEYMAIKYFHKTDDNFMNLREKKAKALIKNLYMDEKTRGIPENTRNRQLSHLLETAPTHATEDNKKRAGKEKYK